MAQPPDEPIDDAPEPGSPDEVPPDEARTRVLEQQHVPPEPPEPPPEPAPPGGRRIWPWLIVALLALVVVGLLVAYFLTRDDDDSGSTVAVPAVVGFSQAEAERQTRAVGLTPEIRNVLSSSVASGTVVEQSPGAGEEVERGSTLTLSVSGGSPPVTVPDLIGLNEAQAGVRLAEAGFESEIDRVTSDEPSGIVIAQEPLAGAQADEGSTVQVTVSRGGTITTTTTTTTTVTTTTTSQTEVPDVVGSTLTEATTVLVAADLIPRPVRVQSNQQPETVLSQTPAAGTEVATATTVELRVASPVAP